MNYKECIQRIDNNSLTGAYLLHGSEEYVKETAVSRSIALIPEGLREFNVSLLNEADLGAIVEACETLPFIADRRIVVCRELSSGIDVEALFKYSMSLGDSALLYIVIKGDLSEKSTLYKLFESSGRLIRFPELEMGDAVKWCIKHSYEQGVSLDAKTAQLLISLVGVDLTVVNNELQKTINMAGSGGVITPQIISACVKTNVEFRVFDMIDCFTSGKVYDGMRALHGLLEDENEALGIAAFLESRFKLMLEARRLLDSGLNQNSALSKMEGSRFANKKAIAAASKYDFASLAQLVKDIADVGYCMMSSGVKAGNMIEGIMLRFNW